MVSRCANPACSAPLRYLRDGRLFQFEIRSLIVPGIRPGRAQARADSSRQVSHFWLCGQCSCNLTLTFDGAQGVKLIPLAAKTALSAAPGT